MTDLSDLLPAETASAADTLALGRRLAAALEPGDVVALDGDLGAGKTHLAKGIAAGLGVDPETVTYEDLHLRHLELIAAHAMLCSTVPCTLPPHATCAKCVDIKIVKGMGIMCLCPTVRAKILRLPGKPDDREVDRSGTEGAGLRGT